MKLIDCFMYFDEDLVLDIRLNTLNDIVDRFVIVEATTDHAGNQKKLNFNKKNFKKFENKKRTFFRKFPNYLITRKIARRIDPAEI